MSSEKNKHKILRVTTVAGTMNVILKGQLKFLNQYFDVVAATSPFYNYFNEIIEREGVRLYHISFTRKITPFKDLLAFFQMFYIIVKENPKIVHTQTPKANFIGILAAFICGTKIRMLAIVGMPTYKKTGPKAAFLTVMENISYMLATHIYPNSKGLFEHFMHNKYARKKLFFIGNGSSNGIDLNYFNPIVIPEIKLVEIRKELRIDSNNFVFGFMGRVVNDKGIKELIDAFLSFCDVDVYSHSRLLIIGPMRESDDPIPKSYQQLLLNHPKIIHVGLQRDVRPYLLVTNTFVFPSYREGLPGSLIQAAAMGLPLIASDIVGNREIISQTKGILVPVKNPYALASQMKNLILDVDMLFRLSDGIRELIANLYEQDKYWDLLKLEYESLLLKERY